jgi:hypothetical protein
MSRKKIILSKECENCGVIFEKNRKVSELNFKKQRFCSYKCRAEVLRGKNHPNWKKENIGITSKHAWLINTYGSANYCENRENNIFGFKCNCKSEKYHYAVKHDLEYKKDIKNYYQLCTSCHKKYDLKKGWKGSSTSFKKGNITWCTGKKRPEITGKLHPRFGKHQTPEQLEKFKETIRLKRLNK